MHIFTILEVSNVCLEVERASSVQEFFFNSEFIAFPFLFIQHSFQNCFATKSFLNKRDIFCGKSCPPFRKFFKLYTRVSQSGGDFSKLEGNN